MNFAKNNVFFLKIIYVHFIDQLTLLEKKIQSKSFLDCHFLCLVGSLGQTIALYGNRIEVVLYSQYMECADILAFVHFAHSFYAIFRYSIWKYYIISRLLLLLNS